MVTGLDIITLSKEQILKLFDALSSKKKTHSKTAEEKAKQQPYLLDDETIADIVNILRPYCQPGIRNDLLMSLSGLLRKENISMESAVKVIDGLTEDDEE